MLTVSWVRPTALPQVIHTWGFHTIYKRTALQFLPRAWASFLSFQPIHSDFPQRA